MDCPSLKLYILIISGTSMVMPTSRLTSQIFTAQSQNCKSPVSDLAWRHSVDSYRDLKGDMAGITIHCDPHRQTTGCKSGLTAFANWDYTREAIIVLCPSFFYYPPSLQCLDPSTAGRPDVATNADAGGIILHELLHIPWLTNGLQIGDGVNADGSHSDCYTYECATAYTANRNKPGVDVRNLPEFVAVNYEMYAYAIRSSNRGCSWSAYPGYDYGYGQYGYGQYGG